MMILRQPELLVLEAVCKERIAVVNLWEPVPQAVVPVVGSPAGSDSGEGVVRFASLECLCGCAVPLSTASGTPECQAYGTHRCMICHAG